MKKQILWAKVFMLLLQQWIHNSSSTVEEEEINYLISSKITNLIILEGPEIMVIPIQVTILLLIFP
jgi:hypothetical protein